MNNVALVVWLGLPVGWWWMRVWVLRGARGRRPWALALYLLVGEVVGVGVIVGGNWLAGPGFEVDARADAPRDLSTGEVVTEMSEAELADASEALQANLEVALEGEAGEELKRGLAPYLALVCLPVTVVWYGVVFGILAFAAWVQRWVAGSAEGGFSGRNVGRDG